jgi:hypothetical protein
MRTLCGFGDELTLDGQTVASIGVLETFTLEPYSNLDNFATSPAISTTTTPLGQLLAISTSSTGFDAYGSATFSPGIYSEITIGGTWVIDQCAAPGGPAVRQWTDTLSGLIESPSAGNTDPCSALGSDGKQAVAGGSWTLSETDIVKQIVDIGCEIFCGWFPF